MIGLKNPFLAFLRVDILDRFYCTILLSMQSNKLRLDCSKFLNTSLLLFLNKLLVIRVGILKMHVRIANREDPDQTASSEPV